MSELYAQIARSDLTVVVVYWDLADNVWNGTSWGAYSDGSLSTYKLGCTLKGTRGAYYPNAAPPAGWAHATFRNNADDTAAGVLGSFDRTPDMLLLQTTTIATLASQTSFTLTAGCPDNNAYIGHNIIFRDAATPAQRCVCEITAYTGSTRTVTLRAAPTFTIAVGDYCDIMANPAAVNVRKWRETDVTAATAGVPDVNASRAGNVVWTSGALTRAVLAADTGLQTIRSATAQAGAAGSITLDASADATTDFYKDCWVRTTGGTGAGQARLITAYNGATKVATVVPNWVTTPNNTTTFAIIDGSQVAGSPDVTTLLGRLTTSRAGYLDNLSAGAVATQVSLNDVAADAAAVAGRLTATRAGYLDNLNTGGAVASQADVIALNQSASRRIILTTVAQFERPELASSTYTIEARTYDGDGAAVNADSTPTLTATGIVTGSLAANLSSATNPATGVYRWTYTVASSHAIEQIRFDVSATISSSTFTLSAYSQVCDFAASTWTIEDRNLLVGIHEKLPSKNYLAGTDNSSGAVEASAMTGNFAGSVGSVASGVTVTTNNDKTGYTATVSDKTGFKLASDGLDSIDTTRPSGLAANFREMFVQLFWRFFGRTTRSATEIKTYRADGTTVATTQTYTSSESADDVGAAS